MSERTEKWASELKTRPCPCRFSAFNAPSKYTEYRRVISSGSFTYVNEVFRIPETCDVMLTRILVSRNKTELEVLQRIELVIVKACVPVLSASLRALYEEPQLVSRPILGAGYAVAVQLDADSDTLEEVNWPISVQLIGLQG